jgi:Bifunctional DNA primase/polymerase, N-terminal/Primase C terminal 2 (PriCT-2)/Family of unknown function (DUF5906)
VTDHPNNLRVALGLAAAGLPIFPVKVTYNENKQKWEKVPLVANWHEEASTDKQKLCGWWQDFKEALPGIELGRADLVMVDADRHNGGPDGIKNLAELTIGHVPLPDHPISETAGGGEHHYFRQWAREKYRNTQSKIAPGVDTRGDGGFAVAPGSIRSDGKRWGPAGLAAAYRTGTIPLLPDWIAAELRPPSSKDDPKAKANGRDTHAPWTAKEEARVRSALECISSETRGDWFMVGAALHATGWPVARAIWDAWSRTTPAAFDDDDQEKTWDSFDRPYTGKPFTLGSLFHRAQENGWQVESADTDTGEGVSLHDFYAYMPMHNYIYAPSRETWPGISVNARIKPIPVCGADGKAEVDDTGKPKRIPAATWLDRNKPVEQMTWAPGLPMIVQGRLISGGGWIERPGVSCFNLYRPPSIESGNAAEVDLWLDHAHKLYGPDVGHIINWLAQRVQRPQDKINHALVLGGAQGIGKDSLLEPLKYAVGPWNFVEISPQQALARFNSFLKSVILRISEARDLGDVNRYQFYDHLKAYTAAPPDVLRVDEKHLREHSVFNCCGVIITTNHKADGIYLPADDRRHFVAWSDLTKGDFVDSYWNTLWGWYARGGIRHVTAYLAELDISAFDPKAPPAKTQAFWNIVDASSAPEDAELADVLDRMGNPPAITLANIRAVATGDFAVWITDRKNRRVIPHRLEKCGYVPVRNDGATDGMWKLNGVRQAIYGNSSLSVRDRLHATHQLLNKS